MKYSKGEALDKLRGFVFQCSCDTGTLQPIHFTIINEITLKCRCGRPSIKITNSIS